MSKRGDQPAGTMTMRGSFAETAMAALLANPCTVRQKSCLDTAEHLGTTSYDVQAALCVAAADSLLARLSEDA